MKLCYVGTKCSACALLLYVYDVSQTVSQDSKTVESVLHCFWGYLRVSSYVKSSMKMFILRDQEKLILEEFMGWNLFLGLGFGIEWNREGEEKVICIQSIGKTLLKQ